MKLIPTVLMALTLAPGALAQTPPAKPPRFCEGAIFRQFDFWIGEWSVTDGAGKKLGDSSITLAEDGCLIIERWTSASGNHGQSYNFYDGAMGRWRQVWVSPSQLVDYSGQLNDKGEMVLEGDTQDASGVSGRSRGTWTANADGSVRQHFEDLGADRRTWTTSFDGIYRRKG